jgi:cryptochrome
MWSCFICFIILILATFFLLQWFLSKKNGGKPPLTYQSFLKLAGQPSWASSPLLTSISSLPPVGDVGSCEISEVPTIKDLGYGDIEQV